MEINTSVDNKYDYVETQTAALTYTKGWHMLGVYSDAAGNTDVFIVNPDGTSYTANLVHASPFVDLDQHIL